MTLRNGSKATLVRFLGVVAGLIFLGSCGGSSSSSSNNITTTPAANNTAPVTVGFGVLGPSGGYADGIWTTVTVCAPGGTTNCQDIPNILVDTGSVGLRILSSALTVTLKPITDNSNPPDVLQECVQFADFSYVWGPVNLATIQVAGETASAVPGNSANSGVPIQIIAASPTTYPVPASCLSTPTNGGVAIDDNSLETLGANGILGIGVFPQDCGQSCASASVNQYFVCPGGACQVPDVPSGDQLWNPVQAFSSSDNNGVLIKLPSVDPGGSASVPGSLIFGIGTQSDNALGSAQVYEVDPYGNFPQVVYNNIAYTSPNNGSYIDSGSNAIYFIDAATLASTGIIECSPPNTGYYCPNSTIPFTVTPYGANSVSGSVQFSIANAVSLYNSGFAVFNDLGGDSGTGLSTDYIDLGLPFFLNRSVFVGIYGTSTTYPNGYWAF